jgi:hypothetical protein
MTAIIMASVTAALIGVLSPAAAETSESQRTVDRLHSVGARGETFHWDPEAARQLAALHAEGRLLPRDRIRACSLAQTAALSSRLRNEQDSPGGRQGSILAEQYCDALSAEERSQSLELMDCFRFGLRSETFETGVVLRDAASFLVTATDKNGRFHFSGVAPGKYALEVQPPRLYDQRYLTQEITINDARMCAEAEFSVRKFAAVAGTLVDARGAPYGSARSGWATPSRNTS